MASALATLTAHACPAEACSRARLGQMKAILRGTEDNALATFNATHRAIKDAIKRAAEVEQSLTEPRLHDLERARQALATAWPFLQQEPDVARRAADQAAALEDLLARETFYKELPTIDQNAKAIEVEYDKRFEQALTARPHGVKRLRTRSSTW